MFEAGQKTLKRSREKKRAEVQESVSMLGRLHVSFCWMHAYSDPVRLPVNSPQLHQPLRFAMCWNFLLSEPGPSRILGPLHPAGTVSIYMCIYIYVHMSLCMILYYTILYYAIYLWYVGSPVHLHQSKTMLRKSSWTWLGLRGWTWFEVRSVHTSCPRPAAVFLQARILRVQSRFTLSCNSATFFECAECRRLGLLPTVFGDVAGSVPLELPACLFLILANYCYFAGCPQIAFG